MARRKGSKSNYKIPKDQLTINRTKAYIEFQRTPHLPETSIELLSHKPQCDTILGGKQIWLRGQRADSSTYMFPIIVDGTRCSATANRTHRINGKNIRRCPQHELADFWIKDSIPDEEYFQDR